MTSPGPDRDGVQLIATANELARACEHWRRAPVLGTDTEFVRERTFYPGLGLIQMSDGESCSLIDPLAIEDLEPLRAVFADPGVLKVFHSCTEDLEVLYHRFGEFPQPVFDTQIAASLAGVGHSMGYAGLVDALFGHQIAKGETRTNWLRRPLTESQLEYAALDVKYLVPAFELLRGRLTELGRMSWVRQEISKLSDARRFLPDPEQAYLRIRQSRSLSLPELARLRSLCSWREKEARRRNLPRNFVVRESVLVQLAKQPASSREALARVRELGATELRRYGEVLLRISRKKLDFEGLPRRERVVDLTAHRREVNLLRQEVREIAGKLGVAPELLATRKTIENLMGRILSGKQPVLPEELRDWREDVVGKPLLHGLPDS